MTDGDLSSLTTQKVLSARPDGAGFRMNEAACKFKHLLYKEVEESVCTLLGHPIALHIRI